MCPSPIAPLWNAFACQIRRAFWPALGRSWPRGRAVPASDCCLEHGLARKRRHDLMREAAQGRDAAGTVEQHVFHPEVAQALELGADLVWRAVERPGLGSFA